MAAPLAAKAAADKAMGDLAGISSAVAGRVPTSGISGGVPYHGTQDWKKKVLRFLAERTIPDWLDDDLRERNRWVGFLDPDIASKKSWSMAVKIVTQRERNFQKSKKNIFEGPSRELRLREFEENFGVWL